MALISKNGSTSIYKDFTGASASIKTHKDGTATLTVYICGEKHKSNHKNERAAKQAWYRWSN